MEKELSSYVTLIAVVLIVVIVLLVVVVISQQQKIKNMQRPRYGFLGKPLYIMVLSFFTVGTLGLVYYSSTQPVQVEQTAADVEVILSINAEPTGGALREYRLTLIPILSGIPWGANDLNKFNIYWTITNGSTSTTDVELSKSYTSPSSLVKTLQPGTNTIKATVFFDGNSYSKERIITVD
ncbi:hypothetical protein DOJK_00424 [Patescibacteria group bacterium]|jgi:hypothetical protein|nr:hypothetical protein DOJK_00424 [Patescibacteria group bacterium]